MKNDWLDRLISQWENQEPVDEENTRRRCDYRVVEIDQEGTEHIFYHTEETDDVHSY